MKSKQLNSPRSDCISSSKSSAKFSESSIRQLKETSSKLPPISGASSFCDRKSSTGAQTPDSRRTSSSIETVSPKRSQHGRLLSFPQVTTEIRRKSFPFPVTAWLSRRRQTLNDEETEATKTLRPSQSQGKIECPPKLLRRQSSWKVSLLVSRAKQKFSGADRKEKKRVSLSDFVRVVMMKRPDTEKKKIIRDLKRKAEQHKVSYISVFWYITSKFVL